MTGPGSTAPSKPWARAGLTVVLGTPTATPPRRMLDHHPDMLAQDAKGHPRGFGARRQYCFSHRGYRAECARIVTEMAQRYGNNPHVGAWQTGNEYGCHDTTLSYSNAALAALRDRGAQRYRSPQALNRAWGTVFWSTDYVTFDAINLPNLTVTEPNPSHVLAFRRFASDEAAGFNRLQTDIIRRHSPYPIAHTYMGRILATACSDAGIATLPMPDGLRSRDTAVHRFLFNHNPDPVTHDGVTVPGAGVHWQDR